MCSPRSRATESPLEPASTIGSSRVHQVGEASWRGDGRGRSSQRESRTRAPSALNEPQDDPGPWWPCLSVSVLSPASWCTAFSPVEMHCAAGEHGVGPTGVGPRKVAAGGLTREICCCCCCCFAPIRTGRLSILPAGLTRSEI